ncbi:MULTISPECIES: flavin reductase family protein [Henriciella]|jgi:flavin reductase|uniref:FMN reductase (NADH) RutF n=1 Tax=Henriciella pelagia TaxID=1977912 RepID=A0ABQ1JWY6_9PROT|nr:flavin reductase family protein [Henriciella pelagia]GGB79736.1 FMN reductase (NADH) RutF [Henriciella pelagia]
MTDKAIFRAAMAQLGSAVCVIATDGPAGRYGITVSAVTSVSDDPPSLIVCVNRASGANAIIKQNQTLCVNVLSSEQQDISHTFASGQVPADQRFGAGAWTVSALGNPVLKDVAAWFDCRVDRAIEYGTHTVLFCKPAHIAVSETANCLIYHGRAYHRIQSYE